MSKPSLIVAASACLCAAFWGTAPSGAPQEAPKQDDPAAMMAKAKQFTQPGRHHEVLNRFVGKWDTETRLFMGGQTTPPEKGKAEFSWLMPNRWLKVESSGSMMGMPLQMFMIMGYDNFKKSYVTTSVSSFDTAMIHSEGDMDPGDKVLISYGTLDEYLTGEHDKMVKSVWRFLAPDKIVLEVHDLPIGEQNTKVFEITYTKKG